MTPEQRVALSLLAKRDGIPIPRKDLEFVLDTLRDLVTAAQGIYIPYVVNKGRKAIEKLQAIAN